MILLKAAYAVIKDFLKAAITCIDRFPKAA